MPLDFKLKSTFDTFNLIIIKNAPLAHFAEEDQYDS